jgi:hypothetical protein
MIFLSQRYTGLSSIVRTQLEYIILFNPINHSEKDAVFEEYGKGSKADFYKFLDKVYATPYDFLVIDNKKFKYFKNFMSIT